MLQRKRSLAEGKASRLWLEDPQLNWPHHPRAQRSGKEPKLPGAPE